MATLLLARHAPAEAATSRRAIIDIGSNSIRLVVYEGPARLPAILFNEKVMAGLGKGLALSGEITPEAIALATAALARFAAVAREMEAELRTVATAAVRDAGNGGTLLDAATALGLSVELLSGEQEAIAAGLGVISAIPDADGIVGDLGGGSLELVRVADGAVSDRVSFPLGVLRVGAIRAKHRLALDKRVETLLAEAGWTGRGAGLPLYLVGGSWRSLARLDMHLTRYPLPVIQGYAMGPAAVSRAVRMLAHVDKSTLKRVPGISSQRAGMLADAAQLLAVLLRHLGCDNTIVSSYGLREGLLYADLSPEERRHDPLIVAAREEGRLLGRFPEHGDVLQCWIAPLFADEPAVSARLRHMACLLADVGWRANPEFRAERGAEIALHGNWVAIDAAGRAMVAQALFTSLGGGFEMPVPIGHLIEPAMVERAQRWGLAIRLGQRLSGGVAPPLERTRLSADGDRLILHLGADDGHLYGEAVARRHESLAAAFDREAFTAAP